MNKNKRSKDSLGRNWKRIGGRGGEKSTENAPVDRRPVSREKISFFGPVLLGGGYKWQEEKRSRLVF